MAAYAVMARIGRVDPHLTALDVARDVDSDDHAGRGLRSMASEDAPAVESEHASEPGTIVERLIRARELWRQTTFYLFDADSWRT
jgi:hypothetical protein